MTITKPTLFSEIDQVIKRLNPQTISVERKAILQPLTEFIQAIKKLESTLSVLIIREEVIYHRFGRKL